MFLILTSGARARYRVRALSQCSGVVIMSKELESLLKRLEITRDRQKEALARTESQIVELQRLLPKK